MEIFYPLNYHVERERESWKALWHSLKLGFLSSPNHFFCDLICSCLFQQNTYRKAYRKRLERERDLAMAQSTRRPSSQGKPIKTLPLVIDFETFIFHVYRCRALGTGQI
jgi:hypothetical protein